MVKEIVIAGGKRTPFGDFGKSLKDIPLSSLATHAAQASIENAGIKSADIDQLVWGKRVRRHLKGCISLTGKQKLLHQRLILHGSWNGILISTIF